MFMSNKINMWIVVMGSGIIRKNKKLSKYVYTYIYICMVKGFSKTHVLICVRVIVVGSYLPDASNRFSMAFGKCDGRSV